MNKLRALSLFAGIGAFEKALERLGIEHEVVAYCEIDKYASKSYSLIHEVPEEKNLGDVSKVVAEELPEFDLMTWGFPCTDISVAGRQQGIVQGVTRSGLYYEGLRILQTKKPKFSIIENVKNLVGKKFKDQFDTILKDLEEAGYNNFWQVINAKEYTEIPQNRERVFIVSIRKDVDNVNFTFPEKSPCTLRLKDILEDTVDEKYYLDQEKVNKIKNWKSFQNPLERVLGNNSSCPTLTARGAGEWHSGMIVFSEDLNETKNLRNEPFIVAQRGRPSQEGKLEQQFEPREDGFTNTLTTAAKDNYVAELDVKCINPKKDDGTQTYQQDRIYDTEGVMTSLTAELGGRFNIVETPEIQVVASLKGVGKPWDGRLESNCRVYSPEGIAPTILTCGGGGTEVKIVEDKKGVTVAKQGTEIQREIEFANTLMARDYKGFGNQGMNGVLETTENVIKVRRLSPRECFRLMGFSDNDFDKVRPFISDTQLYKQAGNSIVVDVLMRIFEQLFK